MDVTQSLFVAACSTNSNSPQNTQDQALKRGVRPFEETICQLKNKFEQGKEDDEVITSLIGSILEKLRETYPDLNERRARLRELMDEAKKQREEVSKRKSFPVFSDDLSCRIFRLLRPEEQDKVLPEGHSSIKKYDWIPMKISMGSTESDSRNSPVEWRFSFRQTNTPENPWEVK